MGGGGGGGGGGRKNMRVEMNSYVYKRGKAFGQRTKGHGEKSGKSNNSGMQEGSYLGLNPNWIARTLRQTTREVCRNKDTAVIILSRMIFCCKSCLFSLCPPHTHTHTVQLLESAASGLNLIDG